MGGNPSREDGDEWHYNFRRFLWSLSWIYRGGLLIIYLYPPAVAAVAAGKRTPNPPFKTNESITFLPVQGSRAAESEDAAAQPGSEIEDTYHRMDSIFPIGCAILFPFLHSLSTPIQSESLNWIYGLPGGGPGQAERVRKESTGGAENIICCRTWAKCVT